MPQDTTPPQVTAWDEFGKPVTSSAPTASPATPPAAAPAVVPATPAAPVARLVTSWDEHGTPITDDAPRLAPPANNSQPVEMDSPTAGLPGSSVNPQPATPGMTKAAEIGIGAAATAVGALEAHAAMAAGIRALTPALTSGVIATGQWAEAHPVAAKTILLVLKRAVEGTIIGTTAGIAGKVIRSSGE
jgi:hypothetical protein